MRRRAARVARYSSAVTPLATRRGGRGRGGGLPGAGRHRGGDRGRRAHDRERRRDAFGVDQPRASRLVAGVVEAGLVRRGSDPRDGRRSVLTLTARGARSWPGAHRTRRAAVEAALAGWSARDRATFARLLDAYVTGWDRAAASHRSRPTPPARGM
jgi:hypothetical protein